MQSLNPKNRRCFTIMCIISTALFSHNPINSPITLITDFEIIDSNINDFITIPLPSIKTTATQIIGSIIVIDKAYGNI